MASGEEHRDAWQPSSDFPPYFAYTVDGLAYLSSNTTGTVAQVCPIAICLYIAYLPSQMYVHLLEQGS